MMQREFSFAFRQTIPVLCGYLFLGIAFGLLLQEAGYGIGWAIFSSIVVYAGSLQFLLVTLLASGAGLLTTALMALLLNARHIFYGLSFLERFREMGRARGFMIFTLTDETYSLLCGVTVPEELNANRVLLWISGLDYFYWNLGSVLGNLAGAAIGFDTTGVDFAMTALFVVIFLEQWLSAKIHLPALLGLACGLLCLLAFGADSFILPAMSLAVGALILLRPVLSGKLAEKEELQ